MKNKSGKHKSLNTFRFQTFSERIQHVNIDVIRRIGLRSEVPEDAETFFSEALEKWSTLNCTQQFENFKTELGYDVSTLPQLVLCQTKVILCIQRHLQIQGSLALQPLLELIVALSRDLQSDFYPHFSSFFNILTKILNSKDAELLEGIFTCLSYLFKFLWRCMVNDIEKVFLLYTPLLTTHVPEHVRNFAAESFAFLIRKVPDKPALFKYIFQHMEQESHLVPGIGQLLFESMKGVKKQFHTVSEQVLPMLLSYLGNAGEGEAVDLPFHLILEAQLHMARSMAEYTNTQHVGVIFTPIFFTVNTLLSKWNKVDKTDQELVEEHLERVLKVMEVFSTCHNGRLINATDKLAELLASLLNETHFSSKVVVLILDLSSSLIVHRGADMGITDVSRLITRICSSSYAPADIFMFVRKMFAYGMFEKDVLPHLIKYCEQVLVNKSDSEKSVLVVLAEMVTHFHPTPLTADDLNSEIWKKMNLDFRNPHHESHLLRLIESILDEEVREVDTEKLSELWAVCTILPHVKYGIMNKTKVVRALHILRIKLSSLAQLDDNPDEDYAFVLYHIIVALIQCEGSKQLFEVIDQSWLLEMLTASPSSVHVLRMCDVLITCAETSEVTKFLDVNLMNSVLPLLNTNLSSPYHIVRLLTLRILATTSVSAENEISTDFNVFEVCLSVEKMDASVSNYRDILRYLQNLDFEYIQSKLVAENLEKVPLCFLLGSLYVNFRLLWDPILSLIESHARGLSAKDFWDVFSAQLQEVVVRIAHDSGEERKSDEDGALVSQKSILQTAFEEASAPLSERLDHVNYRLLLWKGLQRFADIAESKNRELVPLFLDFIEQEYYCNDVAAAPTQNIERKVSQVEDEESDEVSSVQENVDNDDEEEVMEEEESDDENTTTADDDDNMDVIDDDNNDNEETEKSSSNKPRQVSKKIHSRFSIVQRQRGILKTLSTHMAAFAKFKNPKSVFRESEMRELMLKFLSHRNSEIQRFALDYIMAYNDKKVMPYKDNLYNLLSDKTFKTEITSFNVDSQCKIIQDQHRGKVVPLLIRILYGKMQSTTGRNTSGKTNSNLRRGIVMRFLAGTQETELMVFLQLAFQPFHELMKDDVLEMVRKIIGNVNPQKVIPLKRLQASLNLLHVIFSKLGNLISGHLSWLLKLLLCITAILAELLNQREKIQPRFINPLKDLRMFAVLKLGFFFDIFDKYPFSSEEIDALFECAVWPQLNRLHFESLYSPTSLLKLLFRWSSNPRYFVLFAKYQENDEKISVLPQVMTLFVAPKVRRGVISNIINLLENLLTLSDLDVENTDMMDVEDEMQEEKPLPLVVHNVLSVDTERFQDYPEPPNYGTLLLLPHIPKMLQRLKSMVANITKAPRKLLSEKLLTVLIRTSEFVTDPVQCSELINLLLPFLAGQSKQPESVEVSILRTVCNLVNHATNPDSFVRNVAQLFAVVGNRNARVVLCELVECLALRHNLSSDVSVVVSKLNAWDKRRMEEPDYGTRLDGYQSATKYIANLVEFDLDYILLVTFNCCFYVRTAEDISLRESASYFLQQLCKCISTFYATDKEKCHSILYSAVLPEIKNGIRHKDEAIRHEFFIILANLAQALPTLSTLSDIYCLTDEDPEVDFFENIRHIQIHRRARALTRVARGDQLEKFHEDTLVQFLMPIASSFLFSEAYIKHPNLVDAAIEFVGSICRVLSWNQYESFLKYYLNMLPKNNEYPKMNVKIIVAVLEAFHFDLSRSEGVGKTSLIQYDTTETNSASKENPQATKIHRTIVKGILPQLNKCLTKKQRTDGEHKLAGQVYAEDEEILRVPIALAIVKLLQNLPKGSLEQNLPGLFLRLCALLKSRADSIRETTRDTIVKIMDSLGPPYFAYLLKQMRHTMTRGYQVHVMIYTLHAVLQQLTGKLSVGDLDACLDSLLQVCHEELFGNVAEEKEVAQIVSKLKEARGSKSYNIYEIISRCLSESHLLNLIKPLRDTLATSYKHQVIHKAQECFRNIVLGLTDNSGISVKATLIFSHGLIGDNIPELTKQRKKTEAKILPPHLQRCDSRIIHAEPARGGNPSKTSIKTNAHILVEFGLQMLYFGLKRGRISSQADEHLQMLDPLIPVLVECLTSSYVKIISAAMRCLCWLLKFPLPSLKQHIHRLSSALFVLLNKYAAAGSGQGENVEMITMSFKVVTVVVKDVQYHSITSDQLRVLLMYVEQDLMDYTRQATAFTLLKAILSRQFMTAELDDVMKKIGQMSVSSEAEHIRVQCRQVFLQFLLDYPLGKKLKSYLKFYIAQLSFHHEYGRKSALEMLSTVISTFPLTMLKNHAGILFVPLATCLVNDDSSTCRKMAAESIKTLLQKVDAGERSTLFSAVLIWFQDKKIRHRRLASQLCGIFVEAEQDSFVHHLDKVLPILVQQLTPDKYADIHVESVERTADHLVYYILNSLIKIITATKLLQSPQHSDILNQIFEHVQHHLLHPHTWVRLSASQLFGLLFTHHSPDQVAEAVADSKRSNQYLLSSAKEKIRSLCGDFLAQFRAPSLDTELAEQLIKNLVYIAKVVRQIESLEKESVDSEKKINDDNDVSDPSDKIQPKMTIDWMIRRMNWEAKFEVANNPRVNVKRSCVFKWHAAVASHLGSDAVIERLPLILKPIHRELSDSSPQADPALKILAGEVIDLIKKLVGVEVFARQYATLSTTLSKKRVERKVQKAQEAVSNPQVASRKRIKKQASKKDAKKRKLDRLRPTKPSRKRKLKDMAITT